MELIESSSASPSKNDVKMFFGRCKCCLEYGYMKNIWTEYYWEGIREIYGEMLMETFSVTWDSLDETREYICEGCVVRLRDAHNFKRDMLASEKLLDDDFEEYDNDEVNIEIVRDYEEGEEHLDEEDSTKDDKQSASETEYCEVEYLEDEMEIIKEETIEVITSDTESEQPAQRNRSRRRRREGYMRTYKNYTPEDLNSCLEAVRNRDMSTSEASRLYNVPRKTVAAKLVEKPKTVRVPETAQEVARYAKQQNHFKFIEEIKIVLTYTSAIPFKVKGAKYFCAYCYVTDDFEDPDDLRFHARTHKAEWLDGIEKTLRPHYLNEILRIDIDLLSCVVCDVSLKKYNDMFQHLKDYHAVVLDECYTKLIPYKLRKDHLSCALCEERYPNFALLDNHMNAHYCNYMCADCGEPFVSDSRLKHHIPIHNTGKYPCEVCKKVFTLEKYMKKHVAVVHKKFKNFQCVYCADRFHTEYERHTHVVEKHNEKVRVCTCELCGKSFDWRPYYLAHLRKAHVKEKKNKCRYCNKGFVTKHEVNTHEQRHTGSGKHICNECGKNFVTAMELKSHMKRHAKEVMVMPQLTDAKS